MEKVKICVFETETYQDDYDDISKHIPVGEFIEVTQKEYDKYRDYINWYNNKRPGTYQDSSFYTLVTLPEKLDWASFNKATEKQQEQEEKRKVKAKVTAAKRKKTIARKKIEKAREAVKLLKKEGIDITKLDQE